METEEIGSIQWGNTVEVVAEIGQGSNSALVRRYNERVILTVLRRKGEASKADVARLTNLTPNAVGVIARSLEGEGLIVSRGKKYDGRPGQPATMLSINPTGAYSIGVRVDRRNLEVVLINFAGEVVAKWGHDDVLPTPQETIAIVCHQIEVFRRSLPVEAQGRITGVGVALPYNLGSWLRQLELPPEQFEQWEHFDIASALALRSGLPVLTENDGTASAIAELFYGAGRACGDFLYLFIGPAIGGGVVLDGNYLHGCTANAGDIGPIPVGPSKLKSAPRPVGRYDLVLTRASLNSLVRHLKASGVPIARRADLEGIYARAPRLVEEWIDDCADALVVPIFTSVAVLDVPVVVIDGDLDHDILNKLMERLRAMLAENAPEARQPPKLVRGFFGSDAGAIGAATLPFHLTYTPSHEILTAH